MMTLWPSTFWWFVWTTIFVMHCVFSDYYNNSSTGFSQAKSNTSTSSRQNAKTEEAKKEAGEQVQKKPSFWATNGAIAVVAGSAYAVWTARRFFREKNRRKIQKSLVSAKTAVQDYARDVRHASDLTLKNVQQERGSTINEKEILEALGENKEPTDADKFNLDSDTQKYSFVGSDKKVHIVTVGKRRPSERYSRHDSQETDDHQTVPQTRLHPSTKRYSISVGEIVQNDEGGHERGIFEDEAPLTIYEDIAEEDEESVTADVSPEVAVLWENPEIGDSSSSDDLMEMPHGLTQATESSAIKCAETQTDPEVTYCSRCRVETLDESSRGKDDVGGKTSINKMSEVSC